MIIKQEQINIKMKYNKLCNKDLNLLNLIILILDNHIKVV